MKCYLWICIFLISKLSFSQEASNFTLKAPDSLSAQSQAVKLWATQYYIPSLKSSGSISFRDVQGKAMGVFADTCGYCKAALEGTVYIIDSLGKVILLNVAGNGTVPFIDCRACSTYRDSKLDRENWGRKVWVKASGYGLGVKNYKLVPYRTIAVDPTQIAYGSVIYIPLARGVKIKLPTGEEVVHDGYFFAGDTGSAIKGTHIDVFTGIQSGNPFVSFLKSKPQETFQAFVITDSALINQMKQLHLK